MLTTCVRLYIMVKINFITAKAPQWEGFWRIRGREVHTMLKLVKLEETYMPQMADMMDEWSASGERIVPYVLTKADYHRYQDYVESLEVTSEGNGLVPDSTYFCLDDDRDMFLGAVNIRHKLNEKLLLNGGHIGDGIRPSERGKGYGTKMIAMALEKCRELGIDRVLMVCDRNNAASARTIVKNGGVMENEIEVDGVMEQRYWIDTR